MNYWSAVLAITLAATISPAWAQRGGPVAVNRTEIVVETQPVDRWIQVVAGVLRRAGAGDRATEVALTARVVAAAVRVDTTRPLFVRAEIDFDSQGNPLPEPASLTALLPTPARQTRFEQQRIEFSEKFGMREIEDDGSPLSDTEFYASAGNKWIWISKDKATATAEIREQIIEARSHEVPALFRVHVYHPIPEVVKSDWVAQLWSDVERDLIKGDDEPDDVHALRSEVQTGLAEFLEALVSEIVAVEVSVDLDEQQNTLISSRAQWREDGVIAGALQYLTAVETQLSGVMSPEAIARLRVHFRLPPRVARRIGRWVDAGGAVGESVATLANRPQVIPLIHSAEAALFPMITEGRIDGFVDLEEIDDRLSFVGAINVPGGALLETALGLAAQRQKPMPPMEVVQGYTFVRLGQMGVAAPLPLGADYGFWLAADDRATYFVLGPPSAVEPLGYRIAGARSTGLATPGNANLAAPPSPDPGGEEPIELIHPPNELIRFDMNSTELLSALEAITEGGEARRLDRLLSFLPEGGGNPQVSISAGRSDLTVQGVIPGPMLTAIIGYIVTQRLF